MLPSRTGCQKRPRESIGIIYYACPSVVILYNNLLFKVIQLCWDSLNRDSRVSKQRSRRQSDTESQIDTDSDDNRIVQENFSLEAAPVDVVTKCLELVMVFLDCHIHETADAHTAVVKEAWKVFSEIAKKICRQG